MNDIIEKAQDAELVGAEGTEISNLSKPYVANVVFDSSYADYSDTHRSGQEYSYLCDLDDVKIGDKLVVETPQYGLIVTTVVSLEQHNIRATKWIVDSVDVAAYEQRKQNALKKVQIKALIDLKVKEFDEVAKLDAYADKSPELAELLKQYKAL